MIVTFYLGLLKYFYSLTKPDTYEMANCYDEFLILRKRSSRISLREKVN